MAFRLRRRHRDPRVRVPMGPFRPEEDDDGSAGVREPRRPRPPLGGAAAVAPLPDEAAV